MKCSNRLVTLFDAYVLLSPYMTSMHDTVCVEIRADLLLSSVGFLNRVAHIYTLYI